MGYGWKTGKPITKKDGYYLAAIYDPIAGDTYDSHAVIYWTGEDWLLPRSLHRCYVRYWQELPKLPEELR